MWKEKLLTLLWLSSCVHSYVQVRSGDEVHCTRAGYFGHPTDCTRFYRCVDYFGTGISFTAFHFNCPLGTIFDESLSICNHPAWVQPPPACLGQLPTDNSNSAVLPSESSGATGEVLPPAPVPAPEQPLVPAPEEVPAPVPAPEEGPAPVPEEGPAPAPVPAPEEGPAPAPEEGPVPVTEEGPAPVPEEGPAPAPEEVPAPVPAPEEGPAPVPEEGTAPVPEEGPAPAPEEIPAPVPAPEEGPAPVPEEGPAPVTEEGPAPALEEGPAPAPAPEEGQAPVPEEGPAPAPEEVPAPVPAPEEGPAPAPAPGPDSEVVAPEKPEAPVEQPDEENSKPPAVPEEESIPEPEAAVNSTSASSGQVTPAAGATAPTFPTFFLTCGGKEYYRHPMLCNRFYQCLWDGATISVVMFACGEGLVFDEPTKQCTAPDQTTPCLELTTTTAAPVLVTPEAATNENKTYSVAENSLYQCPHPGHFPYELDCLRFYRCFEVTPGVLTGLLYRCPAGYGYSAEIERCQKQADLNVCDKTQNFYSRVPVSQIPLEQTVAVRVEDLDRFFNNPNFFYAPGSQ